MSNDYPYEGVLLRIIVGSDTCYCTPSVPPNFDLASHYHCSSLGFLLEGLLRDMPGELLFKLLMKLAKVESRNFGQWY